MRGRRRQRKRRLIKKGIRVFSNFVAIIPNHLLRKMQSNSHGVESLRSSNYKGQSSPSSERERKFRRCLFSYSIKREVRYLQVVVVQRQPAWQVRGEGGRKVRKWGKVKGSPLPSLPNPPPFFPSSPSPTPFNACHAGYAATTKKFTKNRGARFAY